MIDSSPAIWLTTIDNVWNPFTQFDEWLAFDIVNQHYSSETLANVALISDSLSEKEIDEEIERAIDSIIAVDPEHKWVKVHEDSFEKDMEKAKASAKEQLIKEE